MSNKQSLSRYATGPVARAADRAIDHQRARGDVALAHVEAIADTTDAVLLALYRNASVRAAVELARPEVSGYTEIAMQRAAISYGDAIAEVGRRR